jgi:hypothetical protein
MCHNCNLSKGTKSRCIHNRKINLYDTPLNSAQKYYIKTKYIVMKYYSNNEIPFCRCCGENEIAFLSIDHISGNGRKHRKNIKSHDIYRWLKSNNFPNGYQILCMNCNFAKGRNNKICPHKKSKENFIST